MQLSTFELTEMGSIPMTWSQHMLLATAVTLAVVLALVNLFLGILAQARRKSAAALVAITIVMIVVWAAMVANSFWLYSINGPHTALGGTIALEVIAGTGFGGAFLLNAIYWRINQK